ALVFDGGAVEPHVVAEPVALVAVERAAAAAEVVAAGAHATVAAHEHELEAERHAQELPRVDATLALARRQHIREPREQGVVAPRFAEGQAAGAAFMVEPAKLLGDLRQARGNRRRAQRVVHSDYSASVSASVA